MAGLGIIDPSKQTSLDFSTSTRLSASLVTIMAQDTCYAVDQNDNYSQEIKADAKAAKRAIQVQKLKLNFHPALKRAVDLSTEKGASTWLSVLPIDE